MLIALSLNSSNRPLDYSSLSDQANLLLFRPDYSLTVMAGGDTGVCVTLKESNVRCIHSTSIIWHVWRRQNLRQHIICSSKVLLVVLLIDYRTPVNCFLTCAIAAVIDSLATSWMSLMHMCSVCTYVWGGGIWWGFAENPSDFSKKVTRLMSILFPTYQFLSYSRYKIGLESISPTLLIKVRIL